MHDEQSVGGINDTVAVRVARNAALTVELDEALDIGAEYGVVIDVAEQIVAQGNGNGDLGGAVRGYLNELGHIEIAVSGNVPAGLGVADNEVALVVKSDTGKVVDEHVGIEYIGQVDVAEVVDDEVHDARESGSVPDLHAPEDVLVDDLYGDAERLPEPALYEVQTYYEKMFLSMDLKITYLSFIIDHDGPYVYPDFDAKYWRDLEGPRRTFSHQP